MENCSSTKKGRRLIHYYYFHIMRQTIQILVAICAFGSITYAQDPAPDAYSFRTDESRTAYPVTILELKQGKDIVFTEKVQKVTPEKNSRIYFQTMEEKQFVLRTDSISIKELDKKVLWLDYQQDLLLTINLKREYGLMKASGEMLIELANTDDGTHARIEDFNDLGLTKTLYTRDNDKIGVLMDRNGIICRFDLDSSIQSKYFITDSITAFSGTTYGHYIFQSAPTIYKTQSRKMFILGSNVYLPPVYDSIEEIRARKLWKWTKTSNRCFRKVKSITYRCIKGEEKEKVTISLLYTP